MDSNIAIKPRAGVQKGFAPRDPVPVREAVETDLDPGKSVTATGDGGGGGGGGGGDGGGQQREPRHDQAPHELVADPESREVINRANDVRTQAAERDHPDQALLRQRAYQPARNSAETPPAAEPHANIKA